jgi:hypothetical protein
MLLFQLAAQAAVNKQQQVASQDLKQVQQIKTSIEEISNHLKQNRPVVAMCKWQSLSKEINASPALKNNNEIKEMAANLDKMGTDWKQGPATVQIYQLQKEVEVHAFVAKVNDLCEHGKTGEAQKLVEQNVNKPGELGETAKVLDKNKGDIAIAAKIAALSIGRADEFYAPVPKSALVQAPKSAASETTMSVNQQQFKVEHPAVKQAGRHEEGETVGQMIVGALPIAGTIMYTVEAIHEFQKGNMEKGVEKAIMAVVALGFDVFTVATLGAGVGAKVGQVAATRLVAEVVAELFGKEFGKEVMAGIAKQGGEQLAKAGVKTLGEKGVEEAAKYGGGALAGKATNFFEGKEHHQGASN